MSRTNGKLSRTVLRRGKGSNPFSLVDFTSHDFLAALSKYDAIQRMSGTGRCYDNARIESFFATLKKEKLYRIRTGELPMTTVKSIIWRYVEGYYNHRRIYTPNDGYPPFVFQNMYYEKQQSAA